MKSKFLCSYDIEMRFPNISTSVFVMFLSLKIFCSHFIQLEILLLLFQDHDERINPLATLTSDDTQSLASSDNTGDAPVIIVRGKGSFL